MRYIYDNDLHIHSGLSLCSGDEQQTPERILAYAKENNLKIVCLTDHYWDETVPGASKWYSTQDTAWIAKSKPLPQCDGIRFLYGCETDMDRFFTVGVAKEHFDRFDFVVIPTTHLHMMGFTITEEEDTPERRAALWIKRLDALLSMDLPFHKIGIAHLACPLVAHRDWEQLRKVFSLLPQEELVRLFTNAAALGVGIELNSGDFGFSDGDADTVLRIFRTAKACGCKFYLASDAHHPDGLDNAKERFERAITLLELEETDKFVL